KSGNEALAYLLEDEFACIVLDVKMPEMDGFELAKIIRSDERTKYIPIIFASGHQQTQSDIFKGYETGAVDYLMKPLDPTIVRGKVNVFAELCRKERARARAEAALAKQAKELQRSNAELDQYASVAAHDLQAPLRRIANYAGIFTDQYRGKLDPEAERWLTTMGENIHRMQALISDLLTYSKVGRKQETEKLDLSKLIKEVLEDLSAHIEESGAKISCGDLPTLTANKLDLRQLMQNLIGNAIKYRRKGVAPEVRIASERKGSEWTFSISDNGLGISPEDQKK